MENNTELSMTTSWTPVSKAVVTDIHYRYPATDIKANRMMEDIVVAIQVAKTPALEEDLEQIVNQHEMAETMYEAILALKLRSGGLATKPKDGTK